MPCHLPLKFWRPCLASWHFLKKKKKIQVPCFKVQGEKYDWTCSKQQEEQRQSWDLNTDGVTLSLSAVPSACHSGPIIRNELNTSAVNRNSPGRFWSFKQAKGTSVQLSCLWHEQFSIHGVIGFLLCYLSKVSGQMGVFKAGARTPAFSLSGPPECQRAGACSEDFLADSWRARDLVSWL
jgi:hypothetical protein